MPGRLFLTRPIQDVADKLRTSVEAVKEEKPRFDIAPGQEIVVLTQDGLTKMRWGLIPVGRVNARGRPVMETIINARSETVFDKSAFKGVRRAVIPVDGWYEWTGEKRRKTRWSISDKSGDVLFFAAISDVWTAPGGLQVPQVAAVTCAPNADVEAIHHRMGVLLSHSDIPIWLGPNEANAASLMRPWPVGRLNVRETEDLN